MSFDPEKIYALLPAIYRVRDHEEGGPLRELLAVIAEQVQVVEEDLEQLYDDQFIETCAEWVVPYVGELVGARDLHVWPGAKFSNRAQVANTLAYRRRKGTAAVLEQLARDATNWPASVVEYFKLLAATQYMNHLRPENVVTANLRRGDELERVGTPFDPAARNADVRRIAPRRGLYNIPNVGIYLWRVESFPLTDAPAFRIDDRRFLFNPLGVETRLYNRPEAESEITHLAEESNVPAPVTRRDLARDLARDLTTEETVHYGAGKSILLKVDGAEARADEVVACNLSDDGAGWAHENVADRHSIDPALGRLRVRADTPPGADVRVSFRYGFVAEMGGGEYGRAESFKGAGRVVGVPGERAGVQAAFDELASGGVVEIGDNRNYVEPLTTRVAAESAVEIRAADERRPVVRVEGEWSISGGEGSELTLNGIAFAGGALRVPATDGNNLRVLRLRHCTLMPGAQPAPGGGAGVAADTPRLVVEAPGVRVEIDLCILGPLVVAEGSEVFIRDSIVDAGSDTAVAYAAPGDDDGAGGPLVIENSTVVGRVHTLTLEASNTIFMAADATPDVVPEFPLPEGAWLTPLRAERTQKGCVRFSYVPPGSHVPRRYQCQPAPGSTSVEERRVRPVFTSLRYGDAGYCQLGARTAHEIREGADDDSEMGAFHDLHQPRREANLRARLDEYLRVGLEAGIFYAS